MTSALSLDAAPEDPAALVAGLRPRLLMFFGLRAKNVAIEDLASEVTVRVLNTLARGEAVADVGAYVFGVARKVLLEHYRSPYDRRRTSLDDLCEGGHEPAKPPDILDDGLEAERRCASVCLAAMREHERRLIEDFYAEGKNKDNRAALAVRLGISRNALDQRVSKVRKALGQCVKACLARTLSNAIPAPPPAGRQP